MRDTAAGDVFVFCSDRCPVSLSPSSPRAPGSQFQVAYMKGLLSQGYTEVAYDHPRIKKR